MKTVYKDINFLIIKQKDKFGNYFLTKNKVKHDKSF